ncbi:MULTISPECIES: hypothetical protein [unclassified Roseofilum]|uniref:hypothetical protein n=1 Tax=unclassified Roseofilum TaxID=2620099 RepID=UPI000E8BA4B9|nr:MULTISPECIES: hypothetical protein [unclassified Roseofilum]MBP0008206.1 hypothetical protein [Roseofilum sp. Belize Diploria]MBP0033674.1 hypothetical protein [Roseofilum sp. Belize BBD 4]HBQ99826.1 hypothetical protein [Cyanobacteria bacterium UBA11691]
MSILDQIIAQVQEMPEHLQWRVLDFTHSLTNREISGTPGQTLLGVAGLIPVEDLQLIADAIQEDCSQIDINEW